MKKFLRFSVTMLVMASLFCGFALSAFAADSIVTYTGDSEFVVSDDLDLFDNFKNVMPGDTRQEIITVRNEFNKSRYVQIYMQAVPHEPEIGPHVDAVRANEDYESMMDFLSQLKLTVMKENGTPLAESQANDPGTLATRKLLGTFHGRGEINIVATLEVPIELGNEYADRLGEIDWVFTVDEYYAGDSPKTADNSNLALYTGLLCGSVVVMGFVLFLLRRKKKAE